jgi:MFS family permease
VSRHSIGRQFGVVRREASFRSFFLATVGSGIGTWLALVALQIDVLRRTHSPLWMSALLIADILPTFAVGILAAPLVDRLSRRLLMVSSDLVRAAAFCALPFAPNATTIVALAAVVGVASGFFRPAAYAALPNLVAEEELTSANALLQGVDNVTWSAGALLGGVLVAAQGPHLAYWLNAATFVLSAAFLSRIGSGRFQEAKAESRGHVGDLIDGLSLVFRSRALLTVFLAWNLAMVTSAFINVGEPFLATSSFSAGSFGLGLLMGAAGAGLAIGAFLAGAWIEERGVPSVYGASLGLMAIGTAGAAASPNVWVAAACSLVAGAGNGAAVLCNALLVQRGTPDRYRGRAFTVLMSSNFGLLAAGMVLAGRLTESVGPRWTFGAAGILAGAAAVVGLVLARGAAVEPAAAPQPLPTGLEREPAVEAHSHST